MKDIFAHRLKALPPYLFAEIDRAKAKIIKQGKDLIDLSVGDPDLPPPRLVMNALKQAIQDPKNHRYPSYRGLPEFTTAIADWYNKNYRIKLDPANEVWSLLGSKEGIVHLALAVVNPGDIVLLPEPCFPALRSGIIFAGGIPHPMPLLKENGFLPDLDAIKPSIANKSKLMYLNYPNNPTGAVATKAFYEKVTRFAHKYNIIVCQDGAYSDIYFESKPVSFIALPGAKAIGIETGSFSKMFSIPGWRMGWVVGNPEIVRALGTFKTNLDSGAFIALQKACITVLAKGTGEIQKIRDIYRARRDLFVNGLRTLGWNVTKSTATFYVWLPIPKRISMNSMDFSQYLLDRIYISTTPGKGFGPSGEGYIRISLTLEEQRLKEALKRLSTIKL
jgi:LL-diaminopimelate aminotransferase